VSLPASRLICDCWNQSESDDVSIELTCGECGKTLRVADKYAGRRASCPACHAPVDIPAQDDELEELEDLEPLEEDADAASSDNADDDADDSGYSLDEDALDALAPSSAPAPQPITQAEQLDAAGLAAPTDTKGKSHGSLPLPGHEARPGPTDREKDARAAARRSLITKLVLLVVVVGVLGGGAYWYMTTLGAMVKVVANQPVRAVHALDGIDTPDPNQTLSNQVLNPMQAMQEGITMGGGDGLYVTRPDGGGDYQLVVLDIREGMMKSRNQWSGMNVRFRASEFEVVADSGQTVQPIMLRTQIESPVEVSLDAGSSPTPVLPAGYEPASADYEAKGRYEQAAGTLTFDGSNAVTGEVSFRSRRAFNPSPGVSGVTVNGELTLRDPAGLRLDYAYNGYAAEVDWPEDATGWISTDRYLLGSVTTMELHRTALLIPKPPGATRLTINLGGEKLLAISTTAATGPPPAPGRPGNNAPANQVTSQVATATGSAAPGNAGQANNPQTAGSANASGSGSKSTNPLGYFSALAQARESARGIESAKQMQQIGVAVEIYRQQNNDAFPESLNQLEPILNKRGVEGLLTNPRKGEDDGYIYEPPGPDDDLAATPILWESRAGYKDLSGRVLYADGSVRGE